MTWFGIIFGTYVFSLLFLQFWIVYKETKRKQEKTKEQKMAYTVSNELSTYINNIEEIRYKGE